MPQGRSSFVLALTLTLTSRLLAQTPPPKTAFTGDLGFVSATGNTELSTLNLGDKLIRTDGPWMLTQLGAYIYGETNHIQSAEQTDLGLRADYGWQPRLGGFISGAFERNTFAGFNDRTDEDFGIRWRAIVSPEDSLSLDGGGGVTQQENVDGTSQNFPSARVAGNYKHSFTKTAYFQELLEYVPDLKTSGAYRLNTESALVAPLSAHMGIKVGYVVHYISDPPPKFGTTDRLLTMGVQVSW